MALGPTASVGEPPKAPGAAEAGAQGDPTAACVAFCGFSQSKQRERGAASGLLTTPFHQPRCPQAGLGPHVHLGPPVHAPLPHPARQGPVGADLVTEARLSVCRRLEPRGPGTLGSCPQSLRDAPGPAVSPAPGLAFNCHPCSIRETDRRTRFWAELPLDLVFQTDNGKN